MIFMVLNYTKTVNNQWRCAMGLLASESLFIHHMGEICYWRSKGNYGCSRLDFICTRQTKYLGTKFINGKRSLDTIAMENS